MKTVDLKKKNASMIHSVVNIQFGFVGLFV